MDAPLLDPELDRMKASLVRHTATQGAQLASLLAPPLYFANAVRTKQWSFNGLLRATALAVIVAGPPTGALVAQLQMRSYRTKEEVMARVHALALDSSQTQLKDYSVIGAVVGALFTPAIFLRSARLPWLIAGGAGLGVGAGVLTHYATSYSAQRAVDAAKRI